MGMYITAQGCRLRNELYCVEWDVKLYYTILYYSPVARYGLIVQKVLLNTNKPNQAVVDVCYQTAVHCWGAADGGRQSANTGSHKQSVVSQCAVETSIVLIIIIILRR